MRRSAKSGLHTLCKRGLASCLVLTVYGCIGETYLEPEDAGIDYRLQGEYRARGASVAAQVISSGRGAFRAVLLGGGLPGEGFDGETRHIAEGRREGETVAFAGDWSGRLDGGRLTGRDPGGREFDLERIVRTSPSSGAPPPPGAVVLFDGQPTALLAEGTADARGFLAVPARTVEPHRDISLHLEFRTPFMPDSDGQGRGNSGVYLQERYEIQILDSFGLGPGENICGSIYKARPPLVNMSYPPLQWQSYDIDFREARFDEGGEKTEPARVSVRHNGFLIHDDVEIAGPTGRGKSEAQAPNPLLLQDHGAANPRPRPPTRSCFRTIGIRSSSAMSGWSGVEAG